jgi:ATP/maltotriose-dependent transcriptional regulator MalT
LEKAEAAYTQANERGRRPQPGLSLLRLSQDRIADAAASVRSVLLDARALGARARVLAAAVEILLSAGDVDEAAAAADELSEIARGVDAPLLSGMSAHATGAALLARGDVAGAGTSLREAWDIWRDLEMPYEQAQTCLLLATVCERRGDEDDRRLELDAARKLFKRLNVELPLARITGPSGRGTLRAAGSLSERELQVLHLLAGGKTNRAIAADLFISEKTVARHVSNIFDKLGVSTRTAATAWAYQRNLI